MRERIKPLIAFVNKVNNDWVFNLAGLLAFNFLMASLPLLLIVLAIMGFTLGTISPSLEQQVVTNIGSAFPSGSGATLVQSAADSLKRDAGIFLLIGLISSIFLGSRLFIVLENCFGIIFRLRARELVQQNLMALTMLLVFIVLVPLFLLASIVPPIILHALQPSAISGAATVLVPVGVFVGTVIFATIMFGVIYVIVPNKPPDWGHTWPGAVLAGVLLVLYEKIFPWYTSNFLRPDNSGAIVGFAIVILIFYNFLAIILLLGAELNSWVAGKRETKGDLQEILTEIDAQRGQLAGVVPAAEHVGDAPAGGNASAAPAPTATATEAAPDGRRPFFSALREGRHGRSIVAGQVAALGIIAGAVVAWVLHRNAK